MYGIYIPFNEVALDFQQLIILAVLPINPIIRLPPFIKFQELDACL